MPAILLWFLGPIGKYVGLAIIVTTLGGGLWISAKVKYERIGYQRALDHIAAQDLKAKGVADASHKSVNDCFAADGDWDVVAGVCRK